MTFHIFCNIMVRIIYNLFNWKKTTKFYKIRSEYKLKYSKNKTQKNHKFKLLLSKVNYLRIMSKRFVCCYFELFSSKFNEYKQTKVRDTHNVYILCDTILVALLNISREQYIKKNGRICESVISSSKIL